MPIRATSTPVRVGIVGAGAVSDFHHVPGLKLDPRAKLVAACDPDAALLERRRSEWDLDRTYARYEDLCADPGVDALIIATPNDTHRPISLAACAAGKHVMCEKPLGLNAAEVEQMTRAAWAAEVVHMTAFTYRFAPSMRLLARLLRTGDLGAPRHFRSQRFLDWPETSWGWRQYKARAGAGDLFDMTIHRIDFAQDLLGPIERVTGSVARFCPRDKTAAGEPCPPSEVDDWSAILGAFASGATGVWEGTTIAKGRHHHGYGHEWAEVNGSLGTAVYRLHEPNTLLVGRHHGDLEPVPVPADLLKPSGSPRDPAAGHPATVFRYDLAWEFISAIVERRDAVPSYVDGWSAQIIADAVLDSHERRTWVDIAQPPRA
jgi:predicted dehydrogenase